MPQTDVLAGIAKGEGFAQRVIIGHDADHRNTKRVVVSNCGSSEDAGTSCFLVGSGFNPEVQLFRMVWCGDLD